jgi:ATP-dependent exoDNAse (exonuclease V) alpha subunit
MCTSGARLQLAIAPAGAGKTTAMRALTLAWTEYGCQVIGLAPSAAAAAVLGEQTGIRTETLAKLAWSLRNGGLPNWAAAVGPATLVIIDEAGMADTLSLDTAVRFAVGRGASVRLIGDDQQLAAIGAGGVLRDIKQTYAALHLGELHRFTDPAEAQASLALREGDPSALGFYLDRGRVHVGDLATATQDAFTAWVSDRAAGLDAIMLAPTRELVAELNRRARAHRLDHSEATAEVPLADGNRASVGDVIITRSNDRRLRLTATDWVKNGDRWTITHIDRSGGLTVRHNRSHLTVRLPIDYVRASTGLLPDKAIPAGRRPRRPGPKRRLPS